MEEQYILFLNWNADFVLFSLGYFFLYGSSSKDFFLATWFVSSASKTVSSGDS